jgi:hypothetical protein
VRVHFAETLGPLVIDLEMSSRPFPSISSRARRCGVADRFALDQLIERRLRDIDVPLLDERAKAE